MITRPVPTAAMQEATGSTPSSNPSSVTMRKYSDTACTAAATAAGASNRAVDGAVWLRNCRNTSSDARA